MDANLKHYSIEIVKMAQTDQKMRIENQLKGAPFDGSVDERNTARMKEIVAEIGWPSVSKVGPTASYKTWLLVQHADHDPEFQDHCLALMKKLPEGEVSKSNVAFLEDRVRVNTGQKQIYGTQWFVDEDEEFKPRPIEDESKLDELWEGLQHKYYKSWADYRAQMLKAWESNPKT